MTENSYEAARKPRKRDHIRLNVAHISMQFSDNNKKKSRDASKIFRRGYDWITGTEAAQESMKDILREAAQEHNYRIHLAESVWVAVNREMVDGGWHDGYVPILKANESPVGPHGPRGIAWVAFNNEEIGRIHVGSGHYLTQGRNPGDPNYRRNIEFARKVGKWGVNHGEGRDIVFYHGDQNIVDRTDDTFRGNPFTSAWDETDRYENTGHGNIDVIASFDRDGRVEAKRIRALEDSDIRLFTDHYLVEAVYKVRL